MLRRDAETGVWMTNPGGGVGPQCIKGLDGVDGDREVCVGDYARRGGRPPEDSKERKVRGQE